MRRLLPILLAGGLVCARAPSPEDFVLRVGVLEPIGKIGPEAKGSGAALAGDLLFEPLVSPRPGGAISRFLRRWDRLGPRRWRLEVESGPRFSDGSPVTAEDIAAVVRLAGITVLAASPGSLEVETRGVHPIELDLALTVLAKKQPRGWLGTGTFALDAEEPHRVALRRVDAVPGRIARVEFIGCATPREAFARLLRGELNAMTSLDRALAELLDGVPGIQVVRATAPNAITALFSPRLPAEERRGIAAALPVAELAAAARGERCCADAQPPLPTVPPGRTLRIGYPRYQEELKRAAVALRRALGERGGELVAANAKGWEDRMPEFDVAIAPTLVRPLGVAAQFYETGGRHNYMGYSDAAYDAALAAGDEKAAEEALSRSPPAVVLLRRERVVALDARIRDPVLGEWGLFERLPEWEVVP